MTLLFSSSLVFAALAIPAILISVIGGPALVGFGTIATGVLLALLDFSASRRGNQS